MNCGVLPLGILIPLLMEVLKSILMDWVASSSYAWLSSSRSAIVLGTDWQSHRAAAISYLFGYFFLLVLCERLFAGGLVLLNCLFF